MSEIILGPQSVGIIDACGTGGTALAQTNSAAKCRLVHVDSREGLKGLWTVTAARIAFDLGLPGSPPPTSALGRMT